MTQKILDFLNHERYQVIAVVVCLLIIFGGLCCESKTRSLKDPTQKVTRDELQIEVNTFIAKAELRFKDLDRQDELKSLLYEHLMLWSTTGTFNPSALIPLLASVLGVGAVADNVRKRLVIKKLNNAGKSN